MKLGIPFVGLLLMFGVFADRSQPVLGDEITYTESSISTAQTQESSDIWLEQTSSVISQSSVVSYGTGKNTVDNVNSTKVAVFNSSNIRNTKVTQKANFPQKDGIYLYGQTQKPHQIGKDYIVFEKQQDKVIGALYMPSSEFSCFNGTLDSRGELAMTVTGYPGDKNPTQVATNSTIPRLMDDEPNIYAHSVALQNYYPLDNVSASERQILQTCKNEL
ncbi:MAG: hypothetical protein SAL70_21560 [Scytonema sp. PMC 1070.18]|nr:hypothetical protein [Scytonema sp. PMC 1070.18]